MGAPLSAGCASGVHGRSCSAADTALAHDPTRMPYAPCLINYINQTPCTSVQHRWQCLRGGALAACACLTVLRCTVPYVSVSVLPGTLRCVSWTGRCLPPSSSRCWPSGALTSGRSRATWCGPQVDSIQFELMLQIVYVVICHARHCAYLDI